MKTLSLVLLCIFFFSITSHGQFVEHIVTNGFMVGDVAAYDYDHNGYDDLLMASYSNLMLSLYDGTNYADPVVLVEGVNWPQIEIIDLNGDNIDDIFLNFQDAGGYISGNENFIPAIFTYTESVGADADDYSLNLADINNDDLPDLVYLVNYDIQGLYEIEVHFNLGGFEFDNSVTTDNFSLPTDGYVSQLLFSDMDFDNDDDIILRTQEDEINWWENDGAGSYSAEYLLFQDSNLWPYAYDGIKNKFKGDFNDDGYQDMILSVAYQTTSGSSYPTTALCFLGNGIDYSFNNLFETNLYAPYSTHNDLKDVNSDGNIDMPAIVASDYVTINSQSYHNLSIGFFNSVLENDGTLTEVNSVELTHDLLGDFIYANNEVLIAMGSDGCRLQHIFEDGTAGEYEEIVNSPVQCIGDILDYDLDNDLDIIVQGMGDNSFAFGLITNGGNGNFESTILDVFDPEFNPGNSYQFTDLNSDGAIDCIRTEVPDPNFLEMNIAALLQNPDHTFTQSYTSTSFIHDSSFGELALTCTDINDDGINDFGVVITDAFGAYPAQIMIGISDGSGNFAETTFELPIDAVFFSSVLLVKDMNGDGYKDLISTDDYNMPFVLLNDNNQNFIVPDFVNQNWYNNTVLLDYDMDGILDVLGHDISSSSNWQFCKGSADRSFSDPEPMNDITYTEYSEWPAIVADFNQDGQDDFVLFEYLFLRNSDGSFLPESDLGNAGSVHGCALIDSEAYDFNNDGFPDLINANYDQRIKWYENIIGSPYALNITAFVDANSNNQQDAEESFVPALAVHVNNSSAIYTNGLGLLQMPVLSGNYELEVSYNSSLWNLANANLVVSIDDNNPVAEVIYALQPTAPTLDVDIYAVSDFPLCSFSSLQWVTVTNTGNISQDGTITVSYDDLVTLLTSIPQPDSYTTNTATWNYNDLPPLQSFEISLSSLMPNFNFMGDMITMDAAVLASNTTAGQTMEGSDSYSEVLACSYDPNDKRELNGLGDEGWIEQNHKLKYMVRFQNTGNAAAQTVIIRDQLSNDLDRLSLHPLASSHSMTTSVDETGQATFTFNEIMLPDSASDEPGSHGFVLFEINQLVDVPHLTQIENTAEIYFDLNPAVITNTFTNTVFNCAEFNSELTYTDEVITSSLSGPTMDWYFNGMAIPNEHAVSLPATSAGVYAFESHFGSDCVVSSSIEIVSVKENTHDNYLAFPNPTTQFVKLQFEHFQSRQISIFDMIGNAVFVINDQSDNLELNLAKFAKGVYHVQIICHEKNTTSGFDLVVE